MFLRYLQLGDPSRIASFMNAGDAEAGVRRGMRRIENQCLAKLIDSLVIATRKVESQTIVVCGKRRSRIKLRDALVCL